MKSNEKGIDGEQGYCFCGSKACAPQGGRVQMVKA